LNATELSAYCRERGLYPEQVERWRQASQDANQKPVLTMKEQKELERLRAQDQKEIIHAQCIPDGMEGRSPLHAVWGRCLPEAT
jgi:hypothetical protein